VKDNNNITQNLDHWISFITVLSTRATGAVFSHTSIASPVICSS